jgi:cytidine deaminase
LKSVSKEIFSRLYDAAVKVRANSCSPYSGFKVGAAILCGNGKIYPGCNIESSSFGLTMCAERNALSNALCSGEKKFAAILIVADTEQPVSPCGACRQLIFDYAPGITVIMTNLKNDVMEMKIEDLLKYPFGLSKS